MHMFRDSDKRRVTIPVHARRNIPIGTLKAILKDADVSTDQMLELLA